MTSRRAQVGQECRCWAVEIAPREARSFGVRLRLLVDLSGCSDANVEHNFAEVEEREEPQHLGEHGRRIGVPKDVANGATGEDNTFDTRPMTKTYTAIRRPIDASFVSVETQNANATMVREKTKKTKKSTPKLVLRKLSNWKMYPRIAITRAD